MVDSVIGLVNIECCEGDPDSQEITEEEKNKSFHLTQEMETSMAQLRIDIEER